MDLAGLLVDRELIVFPVLQSSMVEHATTTCTVVMFVEAEKSEPKRYQARKR